MVSSIEDNKLQVLTSRTASCGDCSSCGGGCEVETINLNINNKIDAQVGDFVEITYKSSSMLKVTGLLYIFPLIMMVLGVVLGYNLDLGIQGEAKDLVSFGFGIIFLAISLVVVNQIDRRFKNNNLLSVRKINI